jgi:hypothetical protein
MQNTPLSELALSELIRQRDEVLGSRIAELEAQQDEINAEIRRRYEAQIRAIFEREGKQSGTVTLQSEEGIPIKGEVGKRVKWDSDKLMALARDMEWDAVQRTFDIKFSIPEKTYKALDPEFRAKVDAARATTYGDLSISVVQGGKK